MYVSVILILAYVHIQLSASHPLVICVYICLIAQLLGLHFTNIAHVHTYVYYTSKFKNLFRVSICLSYWSR